MPSELKRAFAYGIAFDASAVDGFGGENRSDLLLHPDPSTLIQLPWRPEQGKAVRMFCDISYPDGRPFERDTRNILKKAVADASALGCQFAFGAEMEFYLFRVDEYGDTTKIPYDRAGYMDIAPDDKGETIRREICLMLEQMGIQPTQSSAPWPPRTGSAPTFPQSRCRTGMETGCTSISRPSVMRPPSRCPV